MNKTKTINEDQLVPYTTSPLPPGPWLVFVPHADDESIGMGGTMLLGSRQKTEITLVVLTDGGAGGKQENLVAIREKESKQAARLLNLHNLHFWRYPDRKLKGKTEVITRAAELITSLKPMTVFFPSIFEYHPDHRATAYLIWQALEKTSFKNNRWSYEITCQAKVNRLIDISEVWTQKEELINCYQSQLQENKYRELSRALNHLRTFSLPAATAAEGFYSYPRKSNCCTPLQEMIESLECAKIVPLAGAVIKAAIKN